MLMEPARTRALGTGGSHLWGVSKVPSRCGECWGYALLGPNDIAQHGHTRHHAGTRITRRVHTINNGHMSHCVGTRHHYTGTRRHQAGTHRQQWGHVSPCRHTLSAGGHTPSPSRHTPSTMGTRVTVRAHTVTRRARAVTKWAHAVNNGHTCHRVGTHHHYAGTRRYQAGTRVTHSLADECLAGCRCEFRVSRRAHVSGRTPLLSPLGVRLAVALLGALGAPRSEWFSEALRRAASPPAVSSVPGVPSAAACVVTDGSVPAAGGRGVRRGGLVCVVLTADDTEHRSRAGWLPARERGRASAGTRPSSVPGACGCWAGAAGPPGSACELFASDAQPLSAPMRPLRALSGPLTGLWSACPGS